KSYFPNITYILLLVIQKKMNFILQKESFAKNDIPTRLHQLAENLSQIKNLCVEGSHQESILNLAKESRYFIEWTVPDLVLLDIDLAAELVDLGRVLTRWLFNWEQIWSDATEKSQALQLAEDWIKRVLEISLLQSQSMTA
ncbi:MAG: hypothetical protein PUP91_36950, partial [Rhizonema sp. PD37]|nr:hypothetical protein [Rhizonema sp. PD37]